MKLNVVLRSSNKICNAFHFKDQIPIYLNSNVIYKWYKCHICNDVYIVDTKRHLLVRLYEHLGRSILTEKPLKYNEKDAAVVRKHCYQKNHPVDSFCFSLNGNAANNYHLKFTCYFKIETVNCYFKIETSLKNQCHYIYLKTIDSLLMWIMLSMVKQYALKQIISNYYELCNLVVFIIPWE